MTAAAVETLVEFRKTCATAPWPLRAWPSQAHFLFGYKETLKQENDATTTGIYQMTAAQNETSRAISAPNTPSESLFSADVNLPSCGQSCWRQPTQ